MWRNEKQIPTDTCKDKCWKVWLIYLMLPEKLITAWQSDLAACLAIVHGRKQFGDDNMYYMTLPIDWLIL